MRTTEFLWQEGHTVHESEEEAVRETLKMLDVYKKFAEEYMAIPVLTGEKSESERFPGAVNTYCIEALMQDRKALQSGTSHFLGQNFSRASDIAFQNRNEEREYAWTTSWGVSTRLIGGLIMVHGDDDGAVIPPRIAPDHVVILPIIHKEENRKPILDCCNQIAKKLRSRKYMGNPVKVVVDDRDINAGEKGWGWVKKGIPVRVEIGPRDMEKNTVFVGRRDKGPKEKYSQDSAEFASGISALLDEIQNNLFNRALAFQKEHTKEIDVMDDFRDFYTPKNEEKPEIHGGFAWSHWCGGVECEQKINDELSVTIRCIPADYEKGGEGKCIVCSKKSKGRVVFARSY